MSGGTRTALPPLVWSIVLVLPLYVTEILHFIEAFINAARFHPHTRVHGAQQHAHGNSKIHTTLKDSQKQPNETGSFGVFFLRCVAITHHIFVILRLS